METKWKKDGDLTSSLSSEELADPLKIKDVSAKIIEKVNNCSSELEAIISLFASPEDLTKAQKRWMKENPLIFPITYLNPIDYENLDGATTPPKIANGVIKKLDKIFSTSIKRNSTLSLHELPFPLGAIMEPFKKVQNLSSLQISWNQKFLTKGVGKAQFEYFWNSMIIAKNRETLRILTLSKIGLWSGFAQIVATNINELRFLTKLDLSGNFMGRSAITKLSRNLNSIKTLISLDLSANEMGDRGLGELVKGIESDNNIQDLNISLNDLTSNWWAALYQYFKKNSILKRINLSFNSIGANGFEKCLEGLIENKTIAILNAASNEISDIDFENIEYVVDLIAKTSIKKINLVLNRIRGDRKELLKSWIKQRKINLLLDNE